MLALGCGTSWFVSQAYAALREDAGAGETDAATATELPPERTYDRAVVISRSGTTTEVIDALATLRDRDVATTAITAVLGSPVAQLARRSLVLDFADERSVVQTRFATGALALLRAHLGEDLDRAISDAGAALADPLPVEPSRFDHFVFLGHRWTVGLAHEAALKMREAAQAHTESYPAMEYRHGPVSVAGPGSPRVDPRHTRPDDRRRRSRDRRHGPSRPRSTRWPSCYVSNGWPSRSAKHAAWTPTIRAT